LLTVEFAEKIILDIFYLSIYTQNMTLHKYPINRPLRAAGIGYFVLFILFIIAKSYLPEGEGGWSTPPIFDYVYLFGTGICLSIITITYTYYSWTLNAKEHMEWLESQQIVNPRWGIRWFKKHPETYALWSMRLISPIGALVGVLLIGFMLFSIFKFLF